MINDSLRKSYFAIHRNSIARSADSLKQAIADEDWDRALRLVNGIGGDVTSLRSLVKQEIAQLVAR